ncbi:hypothetical protein Mapa_013333 [Marchantia paleacea]|nr:hypothetical protein Mapa_013333 [Marchantia paleacea]
MAPRVGTGAPRDDLSAAGYRSSSTDSHKAFGMSDRIPLINPTLSFSRDVFPGGAQSGLESRGERASASPLSSLVPSMSKSPSTTSSLDPRTH